MTANAMQGDREMCLAAGMDDYLTKPIRVDRLVEALNQASARKDAMMSAPTIDPRDLRRAEGNDRRRVRAWNWSTPSCRKRRRCWTIFARRWRRRMPTRFRRAAHSLKSNSNTFGALALGAMARELELAGVTKVIETGGAAARRAGGRNTRASPRR